MPLRRRDFLRLSALAAAAPGPALAAPAERYEDARKAAAVAAEPNITLLAPYRLQRAACAGGRIRAVTLRHVEPDPENAKRFPMPFKSVAHHSRFGGPWPIPYRCLYSRNVPNLFMAGRCVSVTHVALGTVRVMRTGGMMGEVVGMAAALCHRHGLDPRGVYERRLGDLKALMAQGFGDGAAHPPQNYNLGSG